MIAQLDLLSWGQPERTETGSETRSVSSGSAEAEKCIVCGRGLKSPESRAIGYGPVCAAKLGVTRGAHGKGVADVGLHSADYSYSMAHGVLCIVDSGKGRSVTNDAENVIATMAGILDLTQVKGVIYRDTMGRWDELVVVDGQFVDFAPIQATERDDAIVHILKRTQGGAGLNS